MLKLKTLSIATIGLLSTTVSAEWYGDHCDTDYDHTSPAVIWTIDPEYFIEMKRTNDRMQQEVDYAKAIAEVTYK